VIYGPGTDPMAVQVDPKLLLKLLHAGGDNTLFDLRVVGEGEDTVAERKAIVREIQFDPFRPLPNHVDFYCVSLDRAIEVQIPLELVGTPTAVTQKLATITQAVHEINAECLPDQIPAKLPLDVSALEIGHSLHVRDLQVPAGVTVLDAPELTLVVLATVHDEAPAAPAEAAAAEPEVIRERKAAEED
jgi:large subunit ribosomal protein L25